MFGSEVLVHPEMQSALDEFTQNVHKVFEHSSRLMNFPPRLAHLLRLRIWQDFEANVSEVLKQGGDIIELCIRLQMDQDQPQSEQEEALYHKLKVTAVPEQMIRRIFVDLVIAAGDTVCQTHELVSTLGLSIIHLFRPRSVASGHFMSCPKIENCNVALPRSMRQEGASCCTD